VRSYSIHDVILSIVPKERGLGLFRV
jgi:hypothetical protein